MDIRQLIALDKEWLLALNGSNSLFWDGFMWMVSSTRLWIPAATVLLYIIFKNLKFIHGVVVLISIALVITCADQFASGLCKPYFIRFRPTQDPEIMYLVQTVNGYRGGLYGFISSHAANTFAVAMFISLLMRYMPLTLMMFSWAIIPSYSRIYLGVHYLGDILCGALAGSLIGLFFFGIYSFVRKKYFHGHPQYISNQYTVSGYEIAEIKFFHMLLLLTYFYAAIAGMCYTKMLNF